ncbi:MAG TPA: hypothetical protein VGD65_22265 [Chryseosolibacter sp.]
MSTNIRNKGMKPIYVPLESVLNEDVVKGLDLVFSLASPGQYRDALVEIYHTYMVHEHKHLPAHFTDIAERIRVLVEFLRRAEESVSAHS